MTRREELEKSIQMLEDLVEENKVVSAENLADLKQAKQDLADINKPELTANQMSIVVSEIERTVEDFDFDNTDYYDLEYELDYDGRVQCSSFIFNETQHLIEVIVERLSELFAETIDDEEGNKGPGNE